MKFEIDDMVWAKAKESLHFLELLFANIDIKFNTKSPIEELREMEEDYGYGDSRLETVWDRSPVQETQFRDDPGPYKIEKETELAVQLKRSDGRLAWVPKKCAKIDIKKQTAEIQQWFQDKTKWQ